MDGGIVGVKGLVSAAEVLGGLGLFREPILVLEVGGGPSLREVQKVAGNIGLDDEALLGEAGGTRRFHHFVVESELSADFLDIIIELLGQLRGVIARVGQ